MGDRLKKAREENRRFSSARKAGQHFYPGTSGSTYMAHENGQNEFGPDEARRYGRAYGVTAGWLLTGAPPKHPERHKPTSGPPMARLVGYVDAGGEAYYQPAGDLGEVPAPEGSTPNTVAVEIRGDSLGPLFNRWLVFYDDVRRPVTTDLIGELCVVGLEDGRVLIKKIQRSKARGLFHLISQTEGTTLFDVAIEWAAKVRQMVPR